MPRLLAFVLLTGLTLLPPTFVEAQTKGPWKAAGKNGAVAGGGQEAVEAGLSILEKGCNAPDAAVATILALAVTDSNAFCFGGEVPIMVYDARRKVVEVVCCLGTAPRLATRAHFAKKGSIPAKG